MDKIIMNAVKERYDGLAGESCCLSCGGAFRYGEPQTGEVCVDLGSGRGNDVIRLAVHVGERGFAYGIDVSEQMLEKARTNARKLGIKNVAFIRSGLESIDLADNTADLVISNCTINHAQDKRAVWREIYRILKNGGRFVVSDIYSIEQVSEEYTRDPKAVAECWGGAVTKEEYRKTVEAAGFQRFTILEESLPYEKGKIRVASFTLSGEKEKESLNPKKRGI